MYSGVEVLTHACEVCKVYRDVVLLVGQSALVTLQIISVTGELGHPLHLITTVRPRRHLRVTSLWIHTVTSEHLLEP